MIKEGAFLTKGLIKRFSFDQDDPVLQNSDGVVDSAKGLFAESFAFDGSNHLDFEDDSTFYCHDRFSISFWIKSEDANEGVILSKQLENTRRPGLAIELEGGKLRFSILTRWVAGVGSVETLEDIPSGQWIHVTLTNDGKRAKGMKIYLDGSVVDTRTLHNTNSNVIGGIDKARFRIGRGVVGKPFTGEIDELRVYDRTLFADEIEILSLPKGIQAIAKANAGDLTEKEEAKVECLLFRKCRFRKSSKRSMKPTML